MVVISSSLLLRGSLHDLPMPQNTRRLPCAWMQVLQRGEPWPRLQHLGVSCPFVHETIGGSAFLAHCFPELRSLEWRQLLGTQEVGEVVDTRHDCLQQGCPHN